MVGMNDKKEYEDLGYFAYHVIDPYDADIEKAEFLEDWVIEFINNDLGITGFRFEFLELMSEKVNLKNPPKSGIRCTGYGGDINFIYTKEKLHGLYESVSDTIFINIELETEEMAVVLFHEARHQWQKNIGGFPDDEELCEEDAEQYEKEAAERFHKWFIKNFPSHKGKLNHFRK
jgi:hypothetical protein